MLFVLLPSFVVQLWSVQRALPGVCALCRLMRWWVCAVTLTRTAARPSPLTSAGLSHLQTLCECSDSRHSTSVDHPGMCRCWQGSAQVSTCLHVCTIDEDARSSTVHPTSRVHVQVMRRVC
jgi:hypothetical protein